MTTTCQRCGAGMIATDQGDYAKRNDMPPDTIVEYLQCPGCGECQLHYYVPGDAA